MKRTNSKYAVLLLLAIMFAAPGIAAYVFYQHPSWLGDSRINKGTLLTPPVSLNFFDNQNKWRIVLWIPERCDKTCINQVDLLSRVRLALGRKLYQVDQWLILGDKASPVAEEVKSLLKERDVHVGILPSSEMTKLAAFDSGTNVFIVNPDKYMILSYKSEGNPDDLYKDMKLLLNTAENKNG